MTDQSQQKLDCFEGAFYEVQHHLVFHIASSNCWNQLNPHQSSLLSMGTEFIKQNIYYVYNLESTYKCINVMEDSNIADTKTRTKKIAYTYIL